MRLFLLFFFFSFTTVACTFSYFCSFVLLFGSAFLNFKKRFSKAEVCARHGFVFLFRHFVPAFALPLCLRDGSANFPEGAPRGIPITEGGVVAAQGVPSILNLLCLVRRDIFFPLVFLYFSRELLAFNFPTPQLMMDDSRRWKAL